TGGLYSAIGFGTVRGAMANHAIGRRLAWCRPRDHYYGGVLWGSVDQYDPTVLGYPAGGYRRVENARHFRLYHRSVTCLRISFCSNATAGVLITGGPFILLLGRSQLHHTATANRGVLYPEFLLLICHPYFKRSSA